MSPVKGLGAVLYQSLQSDNNGDYGNKALHTSRVCVALVLTFIPSDNEYNRKSKVLSTAAGLFCGECG